LISDINNKIGGLEMLNEKEFQREEKQCADLLGMSLKEYRQYVREAKVFTKEQKKDYKYDNSILSKLGLSTSDLKVRKTL